jgi:hypothetical protein
MVINMVEESIFPLRGGYEPVQSGKNEAVSLVLIGPGVLVAFVAKIL